MITTTLRKRIDNEMRGTSLESTYIASFPKYCARPMPPRWSPWRNQPARSAVNRKVGGSSPPGDCYFACLNSESNHNKFPPIGKQKMLEEITSSKYPKPQWHNFCNVPHACLPKTLLSHHQASHSTRNCVYNDASEFPKQCEWKEFPCDICERSYTLENSI